MAHTRDGEGAGDTVRGLVRTEGVHQALVAEHEAAVTAGVDRRLELMLDTLTIHPCRPLWFPLLCVPATKPAGGSRPGGSSVILALPSALDVAAFTKKDHKEWSNRAMDGGNCD